jgi:hypothetical protein
MRYFAIVRNYPSLMKIGQRKSLSAQLSPL